MAKRKQELELKNKRRGKIMTSRSFERGADLSSSITKFQFDDVDKLFEENLQSSLELKSYEKCINQVRFNKETYVENDTVCSNMEVSANKNSNTKDSSATKKDETPTKNLSENKKPVDKQQNKIAQIDDEKKKTIYDGFYDTKNDEKEVDIDEILGIITERQVNIPLFESNPIKTYNSKKDDFPYNARIQSIQSKKCHKCFYPLLNYGIFTNKFTLKSSSLLTEYSPMFKIVRVKHRTAGYELKIKAINFTRWKLDVVLKP